MIYIISSDKYVYISVVSRNDINKRELMTCRYNIDNVIVLFEKFIILSCNCWENDNLCYATFQLSSIESIFHIWESYYGMVI